jgi:putative membrane protein
MRLVKTVLLLLLIGVAVIFTVQNMEIVKLSFLNFHLEIPLSFASVAIYILGAISGGLIFSLLKKLTLEDSDKKAH